jgi:hypothetical protein
MSYELTAMHCKSVDNYYMTQLTLYLFLNHFLCVFNKCGLFVLAIFSNSVFHNNDAAQEFRFLSRVEDGRSSVESRVSRVINQKSRVVFFKYFGFFIVEIFWGVEICGQNSQL